MPFLEVLSFIIIYIVLPCAGIAALIYLAMLFSQMIQTIKRANRIMDEVEEKMALLDGPINMIMNIYETINSATATLTGMLASFDFIKNRKKNKKDKFDE